MREERVLSLYPESRFLVILFTLLILITTTTPIAIGIIPSHNDPEEMWIESGYARSGSQKEVTMDKLDSITSNTVIHAIQEIDMPYRDFDSTIIPMFGTGTEIVPRGSEYADATPPRLIDIGGYVTHDPIQIYNDIAFATQGWPGEGILGNPYIISGLEITTPGDGRDCIEIMHTRAYFRIESCLLIGGEYGGMTFGQNGIRLHNVSNGQIWGNEIHNHGDPGIQLSNTSCCDIDGNYCYDNFWGGINLVNSFNNNITDNTCVSENQHGIVLDESGHNRVIGNDIASPENAGIFIKNCLDGHNELSFNTATGSMFGIALVDSSYIQVINNTCANNDVSGIYLGEWVYWYTPRFNQIVNNSCSNNVLSGIALQDASHSNSVINNTCTNNQKGIHLVEAHHNEISMNALEGNDLPIHVKDGSGNVLNRNQCSSTGNGMHIETSNDNEISFNNCHDVICGILLENTNNNTLEGNELINNDWGVYANYSSNLNIKDSLFTNNVFGIQLEDDSDNCSIEFNNCSFNQDGMKISSDNGKIASNLCANNSGIGIQIALSDYAEVNDNICCNNTGRGIHVSNSYKCIIRSNECRNNLNSGIEMASSATGNNVLENTCEYNPRGIYLNIGDRNLVANNTCRYCDVAIKLYYAWVSTISNNICTNCTIGIQLIDTSRSSSITDNLCQYNEYGMEISGNSYDGKIDRNLCYDNEIGIYLEGSNGHIIQNNEFHNEDKGLVIQKSNNTQIMGNNFSETNVSLLLDSLTTLTANNNAFTSSKKGVVLSNVNSSNINNNSISNCVDGIIFLDNSTENEFHWNIYESNANVATDNGSANDINYNYWSGYTGPDANGDGFGDTPYPILGSAGNQDQFPLVYKPSIPEWIEEPSDCCLECGEAISFDVDASAESPIRWWIGDTIHFKIDGNGLVENNTFLAYDNYLLEIRAYNIYNTSCTAEVLITIDDTTMPSISHPEDITSVTEVGVTISWNVFDLNPDYCIFETSYSQDDYIEWEEFSETISVDLGPYYFEPGVHNLSLTIFDAAGNNETDIVQFTLIEATSTSTTTSTSTGTMPIGGEIDIITLSLVVGAGFFALVLVVLVIKRKA